jgi:hypothetical protein
MLLTRQLLPPHISSSASRCRLELLSHRRTCRGGLLVGIRTMQSLIERDSYTSSASWSNRIRVPVLSLVGRIASTRTPLGRRLTRLHPSHRLHGPLCGSRHPYRLARRPPGHPPHICVRAVFRRHDQAGSVCRGRHGDEQWRTSVPYLLERTRRSQDGMQICRHKLTADGVADLFWSLMQTKCGHVYCYPCILHYLALAESGNKTRQCPICHEFVVIPISLV